MEWREIFHQAVGELRHRMRLDRAPVGRSSPPTRAGCRRPDLLSRDRGPTRSSRTRPIPTAMELSRSTGERHEGGKRESVVLVCGPRPKWPPSKRVGDCRGAAWTPERSGHGAPITRGVSAPGLHAPLMLEAVDEPAESFGTCRAVIQYTSRDFVAASCAKRFGLVRRHRG